MGHLFTDHRHAGAVFNVERPDAAPRDDAPVAELEIAGIDAVDAYPPAIGGRVHDLLVTPVAALHTRDAGKRAQCVEVGDPHPRVPQSRRPLGV